MAGINARIKNIRDFKSLTGKNPIANKNIIKLSWVQELMNKTQEDRAPEFMIESSKQFKGGNYISKVAFAKEKNMQGFLRFNPLRGEASVIFLKRL